MSVPIYIATSNPGKLREITPFVREFLEPRTDIWGSPLDIKADAPPLKEETGQTFLANARLKAQALLEKLSREQRVPCAIIADDSGLCVDALQGAPGVRSARYAGDHISSEAHIAKLLEELRPFPELSQRSAHYHCALVLLWAPKKGSVREFVGEGQCPGLIGFHSQGHSGFGYDPIFMLPENPTISFGQLPHEEKQRRSHRRQAFVHLSQALTP